MNLNNKCIKRSLLLPSLPEYLIKTSSQRYKIKNPNKNKFEIIAD